MQGEDIKQLRKKLGLSQEQFARRIGKTTGYIGMVEAENRSVSDRTIRVICDTFGVDWPTSSTATATPDPTTGEGRDTADGKQETENGNSGASGGESVGVRLKSVRKSKGLTQKQFADLVGVHLNYICYVEKGKSNPSDTFLEKVAMNLNINVDWLKTGEGEVDKKYAVDEELLKWIEGHPEVVEELRMRSGITTG